MIFLRHNFQSGNTKYSSWRLATSLIPAPGIKKVRKRLPEF